MKFNRWIYAIAGFVVMLCAGLIYAWTNISKPIRADIESGALNIPAGSLSLTFSICMVFFCIGGLVGGMIVKKASAKINIIIALILFPAGLTIAANSHSAASLYLGYGVLVGLAAGFVYNAVMSVVTRWFQDKQGFISGLLLMGFGLGGFILGPVANILKNNVGWRTSFIILGIAFAIILFISIFFMVVPDAGYTPPAPAAGKKIKPVMEGALDVGPKEMIKRPSFWFFFFWSTLLSGAALCIIPNANALASSVSNIGEMGLVIVAGTISIFNGLGRVLFGTIFDKKGNRAAITGDAILLILASLILLAAVLSSNLILTVIGFIALGLAYGGAPSNTSAFINTFYGNRNYSVNLPVMNLQLIVASLWGPNIAQTFMSSSSGFTGILITMTIVGIVSLFISFFIRKA
ncbi:MFS transporter [Parasporobacterium paucivorans]|uniref:MFS transporter, OFA family, oxalate/formate antiporter n=1 Tax=Parasporobacterium paucivorans DSM 15970 TaxID=1122934 RepID=A0A1M6FBK6_9FIRM|nr:MFS transporter [Parasporobacterium paucivorans]SHI95047.1 MFS transporter, OFA family, oxalate/formate antiporter [Parasporobacterium paucivorans DSM 15970]